MENIGLRISENGKNILPIILDLTGNYFNELGWKILFLEAVYTDDTTLKFEEKINAAIYGLDTSVTDI